MLTIKIEDETKTATEMADLLRNIATMIDDGMMSGFYPRWSLDGTEEVSE